MRIPANRRKVIILGIDGMDPRITEQLADDGKLPNLVSLRGKGSYARLMTTNPSESAVAWTTFSTGLNPGSHGIFDFIMRNPENYLPYLGLNEISQPQGKVKIKIIRKGRPFWDFLSKRKIPCFIYFCPNTFPAEPVFGKMLSGMGVPDITGTMGRFTFYTTRPPAEEDKNSRGRIIHVEPKEKTISTHLYGPRISSKGSVADSTVALKVVLRPEGREACLEFAGNKVTLKEGQWTAWQKVSFKIGTLMWAHGIVRFYLKSIQPEFELYASPINFDPQRPLFPISYPKGFSGEVAKTIGPYYTQGMPYDTWALIEGRLDEKAFLEQAEEVLSEEKKIFHAALKEFKGGVLFFYFDTLDAIQHMFWRYRDPRHPLYEKKSLYQDTIFRYYGKIDALVGEVLKASGRDTIVIVLSDHGFSSFRRAVHLNRWLLEKGYLVLKEGDESKEFFENIDWFQTRAYALGFGGIYLNRIGRERYGIVGEAEAQKLKQEIKEGLKQLQDPRDGAAIVKNVYTQEEIFQGSSMRDAPDLFVGFNEGFRASWQTALGGVPKLFIEDNRKKWSGDHLVDPALVPGVIFVNRKMQVANPAMRDIVPTLVSLFDIPQPKEMQGVVLFKDDNR